MKLRKRELHGSWEVKEHRYFEDVNAAENYSIVGANLFIHKDGDVTWQSHPNSDKFPFMQSENFLLSAQSYGKVLFIFLAENGNSLKFEVELLDDGQTMELSDPLTFHLALKRTANVTQDDRQAPFLDALESGEFSDATIIAKNGKHFTCHKCLLSSVLQEANLEEENFVLMFSRNEDVIRILLHYIYAGSPPPDINEEKAKKALKFVKSKPEFNTIQHKLQEFLQQTGAKSRINSLVDELENHLDNMCKLVSGSLASCEPKNMLLQEPGKCLYVCKELIKEICDVALKWLLFCDYFSKFKKKLSKEEKDKILTRIAEICVCFACRVREIQSNCMEGYMKTQPEDISDLAVYLLPEAERFLQLISSIRADASEIVDKIMKDQKARNATSRKNQTGPKRLWKMKNMLHIKELMTIKKASGRLQAGLYKLYKESEKLKSRNESKRKSRATKRLQKFLEVVLKGRLFLDDVVGNGHKKECRVWLRLIISVLTRSMEILRNQQESLAKIIKTLGSALESVSFYKTSRELGFLPQPLSCYYDVPECFAGEDVSETERFREQMATTAAIGVDNHLPTNLLTLLDTGNYSDVEFFVSGPNEENKPDTVFKAHRVVVASRCKWFSRALRSGMKESIDRKFHIRDCSPEVFKVFLGYLYSGIVESCENLTEEFLMDLLSLADRYEAEDLFCECEKLLTEQLNKKNVLMILSFAELVSAAKLKESALTYIKNKIHSLKGVDIEQLSEDLQTKVKLLLDCNQMLSTKKLVESEDTDDSSDTLSEPGGEQLRTSSSSSNESLTSSNEFVAANAAQIETADLFTCIEGLRNIIGTAVSDEEIMRIALHADCDLNRALNHYFN